MSSCGLRLFCLECGFRSEACERLLREGRCAKPKVYTTGGASRRAMFRMWKLEREKTKHEASVVSAGLSEKKRAKKTCRDASDVAEKCFEDEWLD